MKLFLLNSFHKHSIMKKIPRHLFQKDLDESFLFKQVNYDTRVPRNSNVDLEKLTR